MMWGGGQGRRVHGGDGGVRNGGVRHARSARGARGDGGFQLKTVARGVMAWGSTTGTTGRGGRLCCGGGCC